MAVRKSNGAEAQNSRVEPRAELHKLLGYTGSIQAAPLDTAIDARLSGRRRQSSTSRSGR
jgi:hypothetical protein